MLHIQMALYPGTLANYLEGGIIVGPGRRHKHCYHPAISLRLLLQLLDGVEYLHSKGVVHRDLKPTNIFISFDEGPIAPHGCTSLSECRQCFVGGPAKPCYLTARLGDFGLVTAIARPEDIAEVPAKIVGTEFYRPINNPGRIDEKVDVYALGVICFELLWKFGTSKCNFHHYPIVRQVDPPIVHRTAAKGAAVTSQPLRKLQPRFWPLPNCSCSSINKPWYHQDVVE
jgi:eukaryotic translation initiation factor 2-alpha kinase 3